MEEAIPSLKLKRKKIVNFREIPINFSHPLTNEGYVDIRDEGLAGFNHYSNPNNPPYYQSIKGAIDELLLRESVVLKLKRINKNLGNSGLELYFFDCYRPVKVQQFLYDNWLPNYLKMMHPSFSNEEILRKRDFYTAKAPKSEKYINRNSPPPHSTGAAMDVTLRFKGSKNLLFMGTIYDDFTNKSRTDYYESIRSKRILNISEYEALKNRRILFNAMKGEGLENYPFEWWHYSWGDQMWALLTNNNEAIYSNLIL